MHPNDVAMEANRDLVGRIGLVLDPVTDVIEHPQQFRLHLPMIDAKVLVGLAVGASPFPDLSEHALVQVNGEGLTERVAATGKHGSHRLYDVLLFQFVEFAAQGDVRGNVLLTMRPLTPVQKRGSRPSRRGTGTSGRTLCGRSRTSANATTILR